MDIPVKFSKGCVSIQKTCVEVFWRQDTKQKKKRFKYTKTRTPDEAKMLADEYLATIRQKHQAWKDYITPIRIQRKKDYDRTKITCECGSVISKGYKSTHLKSKKHLLSTQK